MSITCCALLLLCLSVHACECNTRGLDFQKKPQLIISSKGSGQNGDKQRGGDVSAAIPMEKLFVSKRNMGDGQSGVVEDKSLAAVSWQVPPEKKGVEKHPGFSMDYLPPKTHPPYHN